MATKVAGELYESLTGQLFEIGRQLRQPGGYPFDPEDLHKHLQDGIEGRFSESLPSFPITVNYNLSVESAVRAGKYDWVSQDVTGQNFPATREGTADLELVLVHFGRSIESEEALRELDRQGMRAVTLPEILALGAKYPDIQRKSSVVALGSVWHSPGGYRSVPGLWGDSGERRIFLGWFGFSWSANDRFAAVRK